MATFAYIAKKPDGTETRGTIDASSIDAAREELRKRGVLLEDIRALPAPATYTPPPKPALQNKPKPAFASSTAGRPTPLPWSAVTSSNAVKQPTAAPIASVYAPLHETLRIFAGWLLAWYGLIYALGFLEQSGSLPELPFVHELFVSPLVLQFTFGTFLVLALSNIHRWIGRGVLAGFLLAIVYVGMMAGFVVYG